MELPNNENSLLPRPEFLIDVFIESILPGILLARSEHPVPRRTSILTGYRYMRELMDGEPQRFLEVCRMRKGTFKLLLRIVMEQGLKNGRKVKAAEKLMTFLHLV